jgi:hypothetical protein
MDGDDEDLGPLQRARRPVPDVDIGRGRRFRDPDQQAEVEYRVAVYAKQVERRGRITRWLS